MPDPKETMRILITAQDANTLRALLRGRELDLSCGGPKQREGGAVSIEAKSEINRVAVSDFATLKWALPLVWCTSWCPLKARSGEWSVGE